ncbi:MAG: sigma-70 family RNA polymerase sigma factor [bacterium]|nr:sigma-70 family RNA polymerase sigma factor [bacterium]
MDPGQASIDPATLLRHAGWVRGLARELLNDPAAVEDVVHDTWLQALERPPRNTREGPSLRAWLAQVVRSSVHTRLRGELRREAREEHVARAERTPSTAESVERVALQRELTGAVMELNPIYRDAVVLRYFDGLPPREIARKLGTTSGVVRTRLSRALVMLRERLDASHGGDRRAWMLAFVQLGRRSAGVAAYGRALALAGTLLFVGLGAYVLSPLLATATPDAFAPTALALEPPAGASEAAAEPRLGRVAPQARGPRLALSRARGAEAQEGSPEPAHQEAL